MLILIGKSDLLASTRSFCKSPCDAIGSEIASWQLATSVDADAIAEKFSCLTLESVQNAASHYPPSKSATHGGYLWRIFRCVL